MLYTIYIVNIYLCMCMYIYALSIHSLFLRVFVSVCECVFVQIKILYIHKQTQIVCVFMCISDFFLMKKIQFKIIEILGPELDEQ